MRILVAAALLAVPFLPAVAQIYRWVDDRGVVNYAAVPPVGVRATRLDPGAPRTALPPDPGIRPLLPSPSAAAHSGPPGDVDRATLDALGRALEVHRNLAQRRRGVEPERHVTALMPHGPMPLTP